MAAHFGFLSVDDFYPSAIPESVQHHDFDDFGVENHAVHVALMFAPIFVWRGNLNTVLSALLGVLSYRYGFYVSGDAIFFLFRKRVLLLFSHQ